MADRNLRYNIGAQDTASGVFDKVARSSKSAHKSMQSDVDQSASKFGQFTQVVNRLADEVDETVDSSVRAINRLESALDDDLEVSGRDALEAIERAGLSAQDVLDATDDEVRQLAESLGRVDAAAKRFGGEIEGGGRRAAAGLEDVRDRGDQSRSVLANLVGNSSQDLGELGGVAGTAGVAIGQLAEYAVDGNIALRNLAGVAGPLLLLTAAGVVLGKVMQDNAERARRAQEVQKGYTEAILDTENAMAVTSETAKNFLEEDAIRDVQDMGANLRILAESVTGSGDDIEDLGDTITWLKENVGDGRVSVGQFDEAMSDAGVSATALSDEIRRLVASGELELDQIEALEEALKTLNNGYDDGTADVEARRAIEEALGVAIDETTDKIARESEALDEYRQRTQEVADAQRAWVDGVLTGGEAAIAFREAVRQVTEAVEEANTTVDDTNTTIDESAVAWDNAESAALRQVEASVAAVEAWKGAPLTAREAADAQIIELQRIIDTLAPDSPLRSRLQAYIEQLNQTKGSFAANFEVLIDPRYGRGTSPLPSAGKFHGGGTAHVEGGGEGVAVVQDGETWRTPEQERNLRRQLAEATAPAAGVKIQIDVHGDMDRETADDVVWKLSHALTSRADG